MGTRTNKTWLGAQRVGIRDDSNTDKIDDAIVEYKKSVALQSGYVTAWNNLGDRPGEEGSSEAITFASRRRRAKLAPNNPTATERLEEIAARLRRRGQLEACRYQGRLTRRSLHLALFNIAPALRRPRRAPRVRNAGKRSNHRVTGSRRAAAARARSSAIFGLARFSTVRDFETSCTAEGRAPCCQGELPASPSATLPHRRLFPGEEQIRQNLVMFRRPTHRGRRCIDRASSTSIWPCRRWPNAVPVTFRAPANRSAPSSSSASSASPPSPAHPAAPLAVYPSAASHSPS